MEGSKRDRLRYRHFIKSYYREYVFCLDFYRDIARNLDLKDGKFRWRSDIWPLSTSET